MGGYGTGGYGEGGYGDGGVIPPVAPFIPVTIETGLFKFATANPMITAAMGNRDSQRKAPFTAFYFSLAPKPAAAAFPCIVLDRLKSTDLLETIDAGTSLPGALIEGVFQFKCLAVNDAKNPYVTDGYLSASFLAQALRRQLMGLASGNSMLPDGTLIKDIRIVDEFDGAYELGADSYVFFRVLQMRIVFQEMT